MHRDAEPIHDGTEPLDEIEVGEVRRPCPQCGAACGFDPVGVVHSGVAIGWATSPEVEALQSQAIAGLTFEVGEFDGRRTVRSGLDRLCTPSVSSLRCPTCEAMLLAVVSYGEVQPARWWLVVEGLLAAAP